MKSEPPCQQEGLAVGLGGRNGNLVYFRSLGTKGLWFLVHNMVCVLSCRQPLHLCSTQYLSED